MGWNSWDCFGGSVTEAEVLANAEFMAAHLLPHGWDTVVVDIQWYEPTPGTHDYAAVSEAVAKGEKVSIPGWISFEQVATAARTGRNPQTGAEIKIAAGKRVKVTAGSKLKAAVK